MATVQEALDRLWSDEGLKQRLFTDPKPVLKEFGMEVPDNVAVHVHENNNKLFNAVLPMKPQGKISLGNDALSRLIARAWTEDSFKHTLLTNPKAAAGEMGMQMPANVQVKIWENTATDEHLVLPANPVETELSDMELEAVSGGTSKSVLLPAPFASGITSTPSAGTAAPSQGACGGGILVGFALPGGPALVPSASSQTISSTPASTKG